MPSSGRVLLGISGGIAAYKAPDLVRRLRDHGLEVRCAITPAARAFVSPLALEVTSGAAVWDESYLAPGGGGEEGHMVAADWTDLVLLAPATADLLARASLGLAGDFLTTTLLAFAGPVWAAPAMHPRMWAHPATREHVERLRGRGVRFVGPEEGPLASGEVGLGRMTEPAAIAAAVAGALRGGALSGRRVLVSAGPTFEPVDPVRFLGNRSSGKMGFAIAAEAARRGAEVTLVAGPVALTTPAGVRRVDVETASDMRDALVAELEAADLVVMAAAVGDFRPARAASEKLRKEDGVPAIELVENPDILAELVRAARPGTVLVGFAAETGDLEARGPAKRARKGVAFLVANDVSRHDIGFGSDTNEVTVFRQDGDPVAFGRRGKAALAANLLDLFAGALP